jgi:hypothetical protein
MGSCMQHSLLSGQLLLLLFGLLHQVQDHCQLGTPRYCHDWLFCHVQCCCTAGQHCALHR